MKKTLLQFCLTATFAVGLLFFVGCTGEGGAKKEGGHEQTEQQAAPQQPAAADTAAAHGADTTKHEGGH